MHNQVTTTLESVTILFISVQPYCIYNPSLRDLHHNCYETENGITKLHNPTSKSTNFLLMSSGLFVDNLITLLTQL